MQDKYIYDALARDIKYFRDLGLKFLVRICTDLGLKDVQEYAQKLMKAEKAKELKEQVSRRS